MKVEQKILDRFQKLINDGQALLETITYSQEQVADYGEYAAGRIDNDLAIKWELRCLHFLKQICDEKHTYYISLKSLCNNRFSVQPYLAKDALVILETAKDDYETGDLIEFRTLIEAEVFDEFLEQAEELFKKGYYQPSAVIAGCILEDGLRKLCDRNSIALPAKATIDPMNAELAKAGIYNKLWQKKITALADLRNKAAHGEWTEFTEKDVEDRFVMCEDLWKIILVEKKTPSDKEKHLSDGQKQLTDAEKQLTDAEKQSSLAEKQLSNEEKQPTLTQKQLTGEEK